MSWNRDFEQWHSTVNGLRTSNEGMNQRYLKNWADMADNI